MTHGLSIGYCNKLHCKTARTDWCRLPEEMEMHRMAKGLYKGEYGDGSNEYY